MRAKILVYVLPILIFSNTHLAEAQQPAKVRKVGVLRADSPPNLSAETFQQAMRDLGYVEGKNIVIEYRYAEGKVDRLPNLAEELVRLNVDVIWALGPAASHAKNATKTIPIIITHVGDPVASGLVASLARPGGNITGLSSFGPGVRRKTTGASKGGYPQALPCGCLRESNLPGQRTTVKRDGTRRRGVRDEASIPRGTESQGN